MSNAIPANFDFKVAQTSHGSTRPHHRRVGTSLNVDRPRGIETSFTATSMGLRKREYDRNQAMS